MADPIEQAESDIEDLAGLMERAGFDLQLELDAEMLRIARELDGTGVPSVAEVDLDGDGVPDIPLIEFDPLREGLSPQHPVGIDFDGDGTVDAVVAAEQAVGLRAAVAVEKPTEDVSLPEPSPSAAEEVDTEADEGVLPMPDVSILNEVGNLLKELEEGHAVAREAARESEQAAAPAPKPKRKRKRRRKRKDRRPS